MRRPYRRQCGRKHVLSLVSGSVLCRYCWRLARFGPLNSAVVDLFRSILTFRCRFDLTSWVSIMPSVTQCEPAHQTNIGSMSPLEIFDKFKSASDNGKDSDSEESFHLPLDDDDTESQSNASNGKDKEETEDEILNKFETAPSNGPDNLDPKTEESILNDDEQQQKNDVQVEFVGNAEYEKTGNDEFKSVYELENAAKETKGDDALLQELDATIGAKPQENEEDLLDISVIRDCEEDDACAIATALEDKAIADDDKESGSSEEPEKMDVDDQEASEKDETPDQEEEEEDEDDGEGALVIDCESKEVSETKEPETDEKNSAQDEPSAIAETDQEKTEREETEAETQTATVAPTTTTDENIEKAKPSAPKRSLSINDLDAADDSSTKKIKLNGTEDANDETESLSAFAKFMQCRRFASKLSRSDLEQFCVQKICECLMMKSSEGELHQTIKKQEKCIDALKRDMQQLIKQSKDLEIVNKKLMSELRNQNNLKKPLVPLKITRSVGLQVRLNPCNDVANQRKRPTCSPQKQPPSGTTLSPAAANRTRPTSTPATVAKQVMATTPQKSPLTTAPTTTAVAASNSTGNPLLSKALQGNNRRQVMTKRTATPNRAKGADPAKPSAPGVIDLTDEDDKNSKAAKGQKAGNQVKTVVTQKTVPLTTGKGPAGTPTRTVATLPQGVRLTPGSVIASNSGGSQMLYVLPTINSTPNGTQKLTFVNLQPSLSTVNGSTVSVINNKPITLKTVGVRKHPAPLPVPPKLVTDQKLKPVLPKPHLTIKKIDTGIILQWKMPYNLDLYESIASYQLYAYQETNAPPSTEMWRKVGDVKALALPMACTLTQFVDKNKYYFAVRSVDVHKRIGAFSDPEEISL